MVARISSLLAFIPSRAFGVSGCGVSLTEVRPGGKHVYDSIRIFV